MVELIANKSENSNEYTLRISVADVSNIIEPIAPDYPPVSQTSKVVLSLPDDAIIKEEGQVTIQLADTSKFKILHGAGIIVAYKIAPSYKILATIVDPKPRLRKLQTLI